jgi:hypothetical protein
MMTIGKLPFIALKGLSLGIFKLDELAALREVLL